MVHEDICTYMAVSRSTLRTVRSVPYKNCKENQNTHFVLNSFSRKLCRLWDNV